MTDYTPWTYEITPFDSIAGTAYWIKRDTETIGTIFEERHAELIASAPRLKEERDELLGVLKSIILLTEAAGLSGPPPQEYEIEQIQKARELMAKVEE